MTSRKQKAPTRRRKRMSTTGRVVDTLATGAMVYGAGRLIKSGRVKAVGKKLYRTGVNIRRFGIKAGLRKSTRSMKTALGRYVRSRTGRVPVKIRNANSWASAAIKRRPSFNRTKKIIKAGPAARSAYKKVTRKGIRKVAPKVRSTVTALARRR